MNKFLSGYFIGVAATIITGINSGNIIWSGPPTVEAHATMWSALFVIGPIIGIAFGFI